MNCGLEETGKSYNQCSYGSNGFRYAMGMHFTRTDLLGLYAVEKLPNNFVPFSKFCFDAITERLFFLFHKSCTGCGSGIKLSKANFL